MESDGLEQEYCDWRISKVSSLGAKYRIGGTHAKACTLASGISVKRISSSSSFSQASFPIELKHDVSSGIILCSVNGINA